MKRIIILISAIILISCKKEVIEEPKPVVNYYNLTHVVSGHHNALIVINSDTIFKSNEVNQNNQTIKTNDTLTIWRDGIDNMFRPYFIEVFLNDSTYFIEDGYKKIGTSSKSVYVIK